MSDAPDSGVINFFAIGMFGFLERDSQRPAFVVGLSDAKDDPEGAHKHLSCRECTYDANNRSANQNPMAQSQVRSLGQLDPLRCISIALRPLAHRSLQGPPTSLQHSRFERQVARSWSNSSCIDSFLGYESNAHNHDGKRQNNRSGIDQEAF